MLLDGGCCCLLLVAVTLLLLERDILAMGCDAGDDVAKSCQCGAGAEESAPADHPADPTTITYYLEYYSRHVLRLVLLI